VDFSTITVYGIYFAAWRCCGFWEAGHNERRYWDGSLKARAQRGLFIELGV